MKISEKNKGILCILGAALCFSVMTLLVRLAGDLPTFEKAFFRNAVALVVAYGVLRKERISMQVEKNAKADVFMRAICGTIGLVCNFYAISHLPLADANMLNKLSPFWATICSVFILKEKCKPRQAALLAGAFIGALFIIKPSGNNLQLFPGVMGLIGGIGAGVAYTFVRKASLKNVKGAVIVFWFSTFSSAVTAVLTICTGFVMPTMSQLLILLCCGISATAAQFFITAAYSHVPAREISVYDYSQVVFSMLWGLLFLNQLPDVMSFVGDAIIIVMAILNYRYNQKQAQIKA